MQIFNRKNETAEFFFFFFSFPSWSLSTGMCYKLVPTSSTALQVSFHKGRASRRKVYAHLRREAILLLREDELSPF